MRVLMFGWEFPPYISGGLGTACHGLTQAMVEQGTEILFVLPTSVPVQPGGLLKVVGANDVLRPAIIKARTAVDERLQTLEVHSEITPYTSIENSNTSEWLARRMRDHELRIDAGLLNFSGNYNNNLMEEVRRFASVGWYLGLTEQFDVIHAHDWLTYLAGIEAAKASGKPLVVHIHATEYDRTGGACNEEIREIEAVGLHAADKILAVSQMTRAIVIEKYGISPDKVEVVHNGVSKEDVRDRSMFRKNLDDKLVLFLGRITLQKGPDYFVEAANIVINKLKNVRFVMAGSGDMLPRMIERVAALRLQEHFHFTGFLRGDMRDHIFAISDLYLMPSVSEPFGITPFEAMLYGVPVILSRQAGVTEVLPDAMTVDFWDVQKMAQTIINVLTKPKLAEKMRQQAYDTIAQVNWNEPARKVINAYHQVLGR